jgi:hypothetical protein
MSKYVASVTTSFDQPKNLSWAVEAEVKDNSLRHSKNIGFTSLALMGTLFGTLLTGGDSGVAQALTPSKVVNTSLNAQHSGGRSESNLHRRRFSRDQISETIVATTYVNDTTADLPAFWGHRPILNLDNSVYTRGNNYITLQITEESQMAKSISPDNSHNEIDVDVFPKEEVIGITFSPNNFVPFKKLTFLGKGEPLSFNPENVLKEGSTKRVEGRRG